MKALYQFEHFDLNGFLAGKSLAITAINDLTDYNSGTPIGKKVECAIVRDETKYAPSKDGGVVSNLYEKLIVKIKLPHTVANVAIGDEVVPINATATVYGDYRNKLSITAEGLVSTESQKASVK